MWQASVKTALLIANQPGSVNTANVVEKLAEKLRGVGYWAVRKPLLDITR